MRIIRKLNSRGVTHVLVLSLLFVLAGIVGSYALVKGHADAVRTNSAPVLYVHGYLLNSCPGEKAASNFSAEQTMLKNQGYTGPADYIDYYACDSGGSSISNSGTPNTYYPGGEMKKSLLNSVTNDGGATDNTDIRHISYQLAWYIYNKYSSKGQTVSVVAHSMGGLITSWMLYQEQAKNPLFPPYLYVQDAVTISTPYGGVNDGYNNITWCPSSTQCKQLLPTSTFIAELQAKGLNGQATNGTDWTAIGGAACDTVDAPKGTTLAGGNVHKVWYYAAKANTPVCYSHTSYLTDTSTALNMPVKYRNPTDADYITITNGAHSLLSVAQAVMSGAK